MKVLLICNMYPTKSAPFAGRVVLRQYEKLKELMSPNGDSISFFYLKRRFTSLIGSLLKYIVVCFRFLPFLFRRYDVLHVQFVVPFVVLAWLYKKIWPSSKVVVTFLGSDIAPHVHKDGFFINLYRFFVRCADRATAVGDSLAVMASSKLGIPVLPLLSSGVDEATFFPDASDKCYDFIFVGSFSGVKGVDVLARAIELFPIDDAPRVCFAGQGPLEPMLVELSKKYRIDIEKSPNHLALRELYNQSKFLILPSRSEGFATVVPEAFFCGVPVIGSDISQIKEQINLGENGWVAKAGSPKDLHDAMCTALKIDEQNYLRMRQNALNSLRECSLSVVCEKTYSLYNEVCGSNDTGNKI